MTAHASPEVARLQATVAEHVTYAGATRCALCQVQDCTPRGQALRQLRAGYYRAGYPAPPDPN